MGSFGLQTAPPVATSVPAEHQGLERKQQRLQPQDQRMHKREGVNAVKHGRPQRASVFCDDGVVVVGIGVGNAAAARGHAIEPAFEERLEHEERAGPRHLLQIDQLLAAAELARGNVVLNARNNHRDNGKGFRYARGLGYHSLFHDLGFDLTETGLQAPLTCTLRDQYRPDASTD